MWPDYLVLIHISSRLKVPLKSHGPVEQADIEPPTEITYLYKTKSALLRARTVTSSSCSGIWAIRTAATFSELKTLVFKFEADIIIIVEAVTSTETSFYELTNYSVYIIN
ncbi:hypothetical protein CDAR_536071 [Caerostris darwini]|uniref:Uncharacterized protein n=1 Tax=Caerostris darwini TaxID=1538125 RepID=A0AAV4QRB3_9ARAC|nr:hypothetical protein CDAR_536071 [Caerostris darwini]